MKSPVLRFPQHEPIRLLDVVAELEADRGVLGERAVVDLEGRGRARDGLQGNEPFARDRVVVHGMTVRERTALHVLAGEPDGDAVRQDRRVGQFLSRGPVHRAFAGTVEHRFPPLAAALQLAVHREAFRHAHQFGVELPQGLQRHRRDRPPRRPAGRNLRQRGHEILFGLELRVGTFHHAEVVTHHRFGVGCGHLIGGGQRPRVLLAHGRVSGDDLVDLRLCERGLVTLVVPVAAVAHQVDDEIQREALAVGPRQPRRLDARDRIVGIDVRDRDLEAAGEAAGVAGAEGLVRLGGEPQLVVGDDVNHPADVVAGETREVQRLGHDPLTRERGVAVNQDGEHLLLAESRCAGLADVGRRGASHAVEDRVHRLEVARVGRHRHHQCRGQIVATLDARARVVLHVAHPPEVDAPRAGEQRILELRQDLGVRLLQDVGEHVEPAAVGHRDHHVLDPAGRGVTDDLVEDRDHHVQPLDREARLAGERPVEEALEALDLRNPVQQLAAADRILRRAEPRRLDRPAEPLPLLGYEHLVVVVTGRAAVDRPQLLDHLVGMGRARGGRSADDVGGQLAKRVRVQAVGCRIE